MKIKNILFPVFLLLFNLQVMAQVKKANRLYDLYQYAEAIPHYLKSLENDSLDVRIIQRLADCYRFTSNYNEAKNWYEKAIQMQGADPINYFYLGQSLRSLAFYNKAAEAFSKFNSFFPDSLDGERYYQYCLDIQPWLDINNVGEVKNVESVNSGFSDFGPVYYKKGIVFISDRRFNLMDNKTYGWTNFGYLNLYYAEPKYYDGFWGAIDNPVALPGNFNQSYHDGPVCFSSDFRKVYITRTSSRNSKKISKEVKTHLLEIYSADIDKNGNVSKYEAFPFNSSEYSVAHPALSADNQKIIFSSDMPGSYGGSDLYMSTLVNGSWSVPVNLGDKVNTGENEVFPFWANDSTLYFSSGGHLGYGGLDIFRTSLNEEGWSEPENLKKPVNSSYDDFGIVLNEKLDGGFFSSNRPEGKGADDIYAFRVINQDNIKIAHGMAKEERNMAEPGTQLKIQGYVKQQGTNESLGDATVFVLNPRSGQVRVLKTNSSGYFETDVDYDQPVVVKATKEDFIYDCLMFRTPSEQEVKTFKIPQDLFLAKLEINMVFKVQNIYYDLDKWSIREDACPALDKLVQIMKQYPIKAELSSHTDSRASADYNMELSQKRAESAVRYIILQGIDPTRIIAKGYGETKLINDCADGISCTEEQHQVNRRTEFRITEIDRQGFYNQKFKPELFKEGDIVHINMFDTGFFNNCKITSSSDY